MKFLVCAFVVAFLAVAATPAPQRSVLEDECQAPIQCSEPYVNDLGQTCTRCIDYCAGTDIEYCQ